MIWKILEIERTKDVNKIKDAYHKKLRFVNPEDDAEGFKELRQAYDEAMEYATQSEEDMLKQESDIVVQGKKTEVDLWLDRIDNIYVDVKKRRDVALWNQLLHDPVCADLDTELEAAEKLLVYIMSHSYLPNNVWKAVEQRFHYRDNLGQLKERFPENFLDYVMWQIDHSGFIDYELFDGVTDSHVDDYISTMYEEKNAFDSGDFEAAKRHLKTLMRYEVTHPFTKVEEARHLMQEEKSREALSIMEELDFEYSDNPYIERIYAEVLIKNNEIEKAKRTYEALLENDSENVSAAIGCARCTFLEGAHEEAKEMVEDILEDHVQEFESMQLLDEINEVLIEKYTKELEKTKELDIYYKLGWCYYQKKDFEKGIALLDAIEEQDDYDYINLRCRLYLANENYSLAYPLTKKWLKLIEQTEDDGTKDSEKRRNRLSLACFSIGVCLYEESFQKREEQEKQTEALDSSLEEAFCEANRFIEKAISEEKNVLVRLSYLEQLAKFQIALKKYDECIEICNRIIEVDKGFYPAYVHRQRANYELKNAKEVVDDYFICKELYAGYTVPYVLAAEVFMAFEQYEDVESIIQDADNAGLQSDGLELYRIKCLHYKNFSTENVKLAIEQLEALMKKIENKKEDEFCDIEKKEQLYRELAILYWDLDQTQKSIEILDDGIQNASEPEDLQYLKVDILSRENKLQEAFQLCQELLKHDCENLTYLQKCGNLYEHMDNTKEAIACYQKILELQDDYTPAVRRLMYIFSYLSNEQRDLEKCRIGIKYASRLIELTDSAEGYLERGNLYIDLYELEQAVQDCEAAIKRDPDAYYAYNNLGCALLKLRRIDEAMIPLEQLIQREPDKDYLPYLNLADCYVLKKQYNKAIEAYENVIRIRKQRGENYDSIKRDIAEIYCLCHEYDKAIAVYETKLQEIKRKNSFLSKDENGKRRLKGKMTYEQMNQLIKCQCDLADVYRQTGNMKLAESIYNEAEKNFFKGDFFCDSNHADEIAEFYRDQGEYKKALDIIKRLRMREVQQGRERAKTFFMKATIMYLNKDFEEAKKCAGEYLKRFFEEYGGEQGIYRDRRYLPARLYLISMMYMCAGKTDKAREFLSKISECNLCVACTDCGCYEYYFGMGMIEKAEGRLDEALTFFQRALQINEDYPCCKHQIRLLDLERNM